MCCRRGRLLRLLVLSTLVFAGSAVLAVDPPPGEGPNLGSSRITQDEIENDGLPFHKLRDAGLKIFTTPFNRFDGYGDGPIDPADTNSPGGRPTLGGNGTFLRVNGLDAQTCFECHSITSNATIPATLGIGGVGGSNSNAMFGTLAIDAADLDLDSDAGFDGRFINPPFLFGSGGVELVGLEMTKELQALKSYAIANPGTVVPLNTKGVHFGTIQADAFGELDLSGVEGINDDLVVRPFGRKGEFATTRDFDVGAMQFHFGMQPVEAVGDGDADGDGVDNEILIGELSALHIFAATLDRPVMDPLSLEATNGFATFQSIGCANCHIPEIQTDTAELPLRFPMNPTNPWTDVYYYADLTKQPSKFEPGDKGGIRVPMFADLKRHDMGDGLAENFALADEQTNREFTTARLWGVADTAPYLHDGRATTLTDAVLAHGGEAQSARDQFDALDATSRMELLDFLRSLRTPQPTPRRFGDEDEEPLETGARPIGDRRLRR